MADVEKGLKQGIIAFKRGPLIVRRERGTLGDEGKRQHKLIALKAKVHKELSVLGARVYSLVVAKAYANMALDAKVKDITAHIKRYDAEITHLERNE